MRKTVLLTIVLLLSAAWLAAQQISPEPGSSSYNAAHAVGDTGADWVAAQVNQSTGGTNAPQGALPGNQTTVEGCLSGSDGNYALTDKSGNTYQLSGDNSMLRDHVGHDVQVTGTMTPSAASSTTGGTSSNQQIINVASLKHISDSCSTSR